MKKLWIGGMIATLVPLGWLLWGQYSKPQAVMANVGAEKLSVSALGRLEPASEVVDVSVPGFLSNDRVAVLKVKQGDWLKKGEVIALLDSHSRLSAMRDRALRQVEVARARLQQVQAGAKTGEIQAQEAEIRRLEAQLAGELAEQKATLDRLVAEVRNAQVEYDRHRSLIDSEVISRSAMDSKWLNLQTAQASLEQAKSAQQRIIQTLKAQIAEAKATRDRIAEVRPVDIAVAEAELREAEAHLKQVEADLALTVIRAPIDGAVLQLYARPGEVVTNKGVVAMGSTDRMLAVAEVYQSDINRVAIGQPAIVTGQAFPGSVRGKVTEIGLQVSRQSVLSAQPGENLDRRVIEVKVALNPEDSKKVQHLTNLQVFVTIEP